MLINALALRGAADAADVFLTNLIRGVPLAWPEADVTVVMRKDVPVPPDWQQVTIVKLGSAGSGVLRVADEFVRLPRLIGRLKPDVVLNPNESVSGRIDAALVVVSQNLLFHCPHVGPVNAGPLGVRLRSRIQFAFYRWQMPRAYARAQAVIPVSRHAARVLSEHAGLDPARVHVVPYGGDRLPAAEGARSTHPRKLLVVGAIAHYKRLREAVEALRLLRDAGGDYELHLAGESWPGHREVIAKAAEDAGVGDSVRFLGALPDSRLAKAFAEAHAGVALSACESFSIPVVEGMRAGLPYVVADDPWSQELEGAIHVKATEPRAVAEAIQGLEDGDEWRRRAEAARSSAARYTWKSNADGIAAVVAEVAASRVARSRSAGARARTS